ncbi:Rpn family recombination-promoting nuclease/putative transposase [Lysinibacillus piscis]|uniref:Transposase (putative) YhgA-like domain-containing protein n=1 Tax=Lysinibacillus piscis TaxID=2518931 RepID=A0ABQ5NG91_9BACI|nr:Rpn family recombination-promoting nuclease/putative transposase [Lysinibacillus sp. KH24]GLC87138.1 hypothetical protein LYSBPC_02650 [Lysinibacillus sp. KH24]
MKANIQHKDSVFSLYLSDPKRLIDVYNAVQGTNYALDTPVEINTLENVLYKDRINDVSFVLDGKFVVLVEHQSTVCTNMPLRMLMYIGRLYEKMTVGENIYGSTPIPLPAPEFLVLYNGEESLPKEQIMSLSDAFEDTPHTNTLELSVKVINIKYGQNDAILEKSNTLKDYGFFIYTVQQYRKEGLPLADAIHQAVQDCKRQGIMQEFLEKHASEVENMLLHEWNLEEQLKFSEEEGIKKGIEREKFETARNLIGLGLDDGVIVKATKLTLEQVEAIRKEQ